MGVGGSAVNYEQSSEPFHSYGKRVNQDLAKISSR